jgi:hypothetical protein
MREQRMLLVDVLEKAGFEGWAAHDGLDARRWLSPKSDKPRYGMRRDDFIGYPA